MKRLAERLEPRGLVLAGAGLLVIGALLAWFHGLARDVARYGELRSVRADSARSVRSGAEQASEARLAAAAREVAALEERLYGRRGDGREGDLSPSELASRIIGALDRLGRRHRVSLASVEPGQRAEVLGFAEAPFDVEVRGRYFDLYAWLLEAEAELRPMVVKQFRIAPAGADGLLAMTVRVVSYRAPAQGP